MTCACNIPLALLITVLVAGGQAHACTPPERPFLPASREDMRKRDADHLLPFLS